MKHRKFFSYILIFIFIFLICFGNTISLSHVHASELVDRVYGSSRFETSYAIADQLKSQMKVEKFSSVIITNGMNYPDALSGSSLSAETNAPILMVNTNNPASIDSLVTYIHNNLTQEGTIYILGGTNAVSDELDSLLSEYTIIRLAGEDRYETNIEILNKISIGDKPLLICTGKNFADSLSASATGLPILLVNESLTDTQKDFLIESAFNQTYIIGGNAAVNETIEEELTSYVSSVQRIYGENRYQTSVEIAKTFFPEASSAIIAYAWNFPDGLSGGPLAHAKKIPLILTGANMEKKPDCAAELSAATEARNYTKENEIYYGVALGGNAVLTEYTVNLVFHLPIAEEIEDQIVVLDPGHGAAGTGAFKNWNTFVVDEAVVNYKLSQYTKSYLEEHYENVTVYVTKSKITESPSLTNRVKFGVEKNADVFVSQHVNSTGEQITTANGVYALVPTVDKSHSFNKEIALESQKLGRLILEQLEMIGWKNNGYMFRLSSDNSKYPDGSKADYYSIVKKCREAKIPGLIIEHGFCNNLNDAKKLSDEEMLKKTGVADAIGIANYLNLAPKIEHQHDEGISFVFQKANLDNDGIIISKCSACNEILYQTPIPKITEIGFTEDQFIYNGTEIHPEIIIKDIEDNILNLSQDYTVSYDEGCIEIGEYNITITFIGKYEGQENLTFMIQEPQQQGFIEENNSSEDNIAP